MVLCNLLRRNLPRRRSTPGSFRPYSDRRMAPVPATVDAASPTAPQWPPFIRRPWLATSPLSLMNFLSAVSAEGCGAQSRRPLRFRYPDQDGRRTWGKLFPGFRENCFFPLFFRRVSRTSNASSSFGRFRQRINISESETVAKFRLRGKMLLMRERGGEGEERTFAFFRKVHRSIDLRGG